MTPLSPLQLTQHSFIGIAVETNPKGTSTGEVAMEPQISFRSSPEKPNQWILGLRVVSKSANSEAPFLYEIDVSIQGIVEVSEGFPKEKREQLATVNGLSLLYSAIREMVLTISGRSAHGPISLPVLSFMEILAKKPSLENKDDKIAAPVAPTLVATEQK